MAHRPGLDGQWWLDVHWWAVGLEPQTNTAGREPVDIVMDARLASMIAELRALLDKPSDV